MSVVVNCADQIAQHFNTTSSVVLSVYNQYTFNYSTLMFYGCIITLIVVFFLSLCVAFYVYKIEHGNDLVDFMLPFFACIWLFGIIGLLILLMIVTQCVDASQIGVQYHMYDNWARHFVGISV